jgi:hypothetical protein
MRSDDIHHLTDSASAARWTLAIRDFIARIGETAGGSFPSMNKILSGSMEPEH